MDAAYRMRQNGGKARAAKLSDEQKRAIAAKGGAASAKKLTKAQHKKRMKELAALRWGSKGKPVKRSRKAAA